MKITTIRDILKAFEDKMFMATPAEVAGWMVKDVVRICKNIGETSINDQDRTARENHLVNSLLEGFEEYKASRKKKLLIDTRIAKVKDERFLIDTDINQEFPEGYKGIVLYANGDGQGQLLQWTGPFVRNSSGAKYRILAASCELMDLEIRPVLKEVFITW